MRQVARELLPAEIVARPKQGFMFPVAHWLNEDAAGDHRASLLRGSLVGEGWIERAAIEGLFTEHLANRVDHHVRIWLLLNLEAWFRIYMLGEHVAERAAAPAGAL
jgi:asparagine synthase (glutamine-hydrolysing)